MKSSDRGSCPTSTWMQLIEKLGISWQLSDGEWHTSIRANLSISGRFEMDVRLGEPDDGESLKQVGKDPAREYQVHLLRLG